MAWMGSHSFEVRKGSFTGIMRLHGVDLLWFAFSLSIRCEVAHLQESWNDMAWVRTPLRSEGFLSFMGEFYLSHDDSTHSIA